MKVLFSTPDILFHSSQRTVCPLLVGFPAWLSPAPPLLIPLPSPLLPPGLFLEPREGGPTIERWHPLLAWLPGCQPRNFNPLFPSQAVLFPSQAVLFPSQAVLFRLHVCFFCVTTFQPIVLTFSGRFHAFYGQYVSRASPPSSVVLHLPGDNDTPFS